MGAASQNANRQRTTGTDGRLGRIRKPRKGETHGIQRIDF